LSGDEILNVVSGYSGGRLTSLGEAINQKVELFVAFYYARYSDQFKHKNVTYIPICKRKWRINIIKNNFFRSFVDFEDLQIYIDIIKAVKPDIIHIHGSENPFGCILNVTDIPVILSYQGSCTVINHKYYSGIEKEYGSYKGTKLFCPYTWIFNKSYNQKYRTSTREREREIRNLKFCKNIIGRTDWDKRVTRILAPQSAYYHCDEILRESFYHYMWEKSANTKTIVHTTSGSGFFKGFETICLALNEINNIGLNLEWRIAGLVEDSILVKTVKRKLKKNFPTQALVLFGNLNENELINRMLEADIYVMPSHIENSPNSLCEAMMLGMPCITTLAGGSSSILKDKEEGLVIQDGDPWSMAGAILDLVKNESQAIEYGKAARKKAMQRHDKERIINDLLQIYAIVVTENSKYH